MSSQGDLGSTQAVIVDAHDVSRLEIEYVSAKSALTQRDYKTALAHYRTIANTLKGSADVPDSVSFLSLLASPTFTSNADRLVLSLWHSCLWMGRSYGTSTWSACLPLGLTPRYLDLKPHLRRRFAHARAPQIAATAELFLSLPLNEQDVSALFSVSQALFQLGKYEEVGRHVHTRACTTSSALRLRVRGALQALSVLERIGSAMPAAKMGKNKTTAAPHAALRVRRVVQTTVQHMGGLIISRVQVRLNNNKAMVMARLGRHEDALNHLQAVQDLATVKGTLGSLALFRVLALTLVR